MVPRTMVSPNRTRALPFQPPMRKGGGGCSAVFNSNLKFDEVQNQLSDTGKPPTAMNSDAFLNTLFHVDLQQMHMPSSSVNSVPLVGDSSIDCDPDHKALDKLCRAMAQQEEECSVEGPVPLWETKSHDLFINGSMNFRVPVGNKIERDSQALMAIDPIIQQPSDWFQYQLAQKQQEEQQQHMELLSAGYPSYGSAILNGEFVENHHQIAMPVVSMPVVRAASLDSQSVVETKVSDVTVDKSIERRQKRMIKNRESAARSRARKQAYISQLEEEVRQLTVRNRRLKQQKEEDMRLSSSQTTPLPRFQLRRTSSAPF